MSEWCELPLKIDSTAVESGIYMANVIIQDLNLLNAVSWQSWTAVNGDGLLDFGDNGLVTYQRYYAFKHFSGFIEPGMERIEVLDSFNENSQIASTAFSDGRKAVIVLVNNGEESEIRLSGVYCKAKIYRTDSERGCESIYSGRFLRKTTLPAKSITTLVLT